MQEEWVCTRERVECDLVVEFCVGGGDGGGVGHDGIVQTFVRGRFGEGREVFERRVIKFRF